MNPTGERWSAKSRGPARRVRATLAAGAIAHVWISFPMADVPREGIGKLWTDHKDSHRLLGPTPSTAANPRASATARRATENRFRTCLTPIFRFIRFTTYPLSILPHPIKPI